MNGFVSFGFHTVEYITVCSGIIGTVRHQNLFASKFIDDNIQSANMVRIRVCANYIVKLCDALFLKIELDCRTLRIIPGINQHSMGANCNKCRVSLPDINKMDIQFTRLCGLLFSGSILFFICFLIVRSACFVFGFRTATFLGNILCLFFIL